MREYTCNDCGQNFDLSDFSEKKDLNCIYCNSEDIFEVSICCGEKIDDVRICPACKEQV